MSAFEAYSSQKKKLGEKSKKSKHSFRKLNSDEITAELELLMKGKESHISANFTDSLKEAETKHKRTKKQKDESQIKNFLEAINGHQELNGQTENNNEVAKKKRKLTKNTSDSTLHSNDKAKSPKHKLEVDPELGGSMKMLKSMKQSQLNNQEPNMESVASKAVKYLESLLCPIKPSQFFSTYWETQPLFVARNCEDYYGDMLTSSDIDKILRENPLYFGRNVDLVIYQNEVRTTMNPVGRATPSIVWDAYGQGHSVRILNPQTYNDKIHLILATLQEYFGTLVGANVYLTPAGSQGFAPHYDDIEAFIVQLEGRKYWKLYKPQKNSDYLARTSSNDFNREELGVPIFEGALNAGDILYFPRGTVHEAKTDSEKHSLHLTISTYQKTSYADLIESVLSKALKFATNNDLEYRKGLPIGYLKHVGLINSDKQTPERMQLLNTCKNLMMKLVNYAPIDQAADELGRKFMHDSLPPYFESAENECTSKRNGFALDNGLVKNKCSLQLKTSIRLVRYYACRLALNEETNQGTLYFATQNPKVYHAEEEQSIDVDLNFGPVIEVLQHQYPNFIKIDALPYEDKESLINFLTELWDYEIIATKRPMMEI